MFTDWWQSYLALLIFYASFNIALFSGIKPAPWEGSIVFAFFLAVALIYIFLFAVLYQRHCLLDIQTTCATYSVLQSPSNGDYLYASTVVFTTLGFGDILPKAGAGTYCCGDPSPDRDDVQRDRDIDHFGTLGLVFSQGRVSGNSQSLMTANMHRFRRTGFAHTSKALEDMSTLLSALSTSGHR